MLLLADRLEKQGLAPDINVDERRLPVSSPHLGLLYVKRPARVQPPEDAPTEYDVHASTGHAIRPGASPCHPSHLPSMTLVTGRCE